MNVWTIAGRLGRDAETRTTDGGQVVTNFSVAVDEYAGKGERRALWIDCTWWGERGAKVAEYLTKGKFVTITGQAGVRTFDGRNGVQAISTMRVNDVTLGAGGESDGQQRQATSRPAASAPAQGQRAASAPAPQRQAPPPDSFDDDIPF